MKCKSYIILFLSTLAFSACYEDYELPIDEEVIVEEPKIFIESGITGKLSNAAGELLNDATLEINDLDYIQEDPFFLIQAKDLKKKGQLIKVYHESKMIGFSNSFLVENDINPIDIYYFPKISFFDINASIAYRQAYLSMASEAIDLPEVSLLEIAEINQSLPVQSGFGEFGKRLLLDPKSGFSINYKNENENYLSQTPIDVTLEIEDLGISDLGLFAMNKHGDWQWQLEVTGRETIALEKTGMYLLASYQEGIFIEGQVSKDDSPVAYQEMSWTTSSGQKKFSSTVNGKYIEMLPIKSQIDLTLISPCEKLIIKEKIESQQSDIPQQNIKIIKDEDHLKLVSKIFDCEGNLAEVPAVKIINNENGDSYFLFGEDQINNWVPVCEGNFSIAAFDISTQTTGPLLPWSNQINDEVDYLTECSDFENGYSYIEINGESKIFDPFGVTIENGQTFLVSQDNKIRFRIKGDMEQRFNVEDINVYINDETIGSGYFISCENSTLGCGLDDFVFTHLDNQDGWVRASFSGTMWMQKLNPVRAGNYPVSGQILIKQD